MRYFERWMAVPGALVLAGAAGAVNKLLNGEHALGTTAAVPWGILIAGYVFFAATASGVGLVSAAGHFSGRREFAAIEKRALFLALSILLPGFGLIGLELGNPLNLIYIMLSPNFHSGIWWMGFFYSIYMGLLMVECYFSQVDPYNKNLKFIGALAMLNKVVAVCNLGGIFALIATRPFWHGLYFPIYILVTAILSGAAALIAVVYLTARRKGEAMDGIMAVLRKTMITALGVTAVLTMWKTYSGFSAAVPGLKEATAALINGPLAWRFWGLEVGLGLALPLALLLTGSGKAGRMLFAAVISLLGVFAMRVDFVAVGQIIPQIVVEGNQHTLFQLYVPSWTEWALIAGAAGVSALIFSFCEKRFNLDAEDVDKASADRFAAKTEKTVSV